MMPRPSKRSDWKFCDDVRSCASPHGRCLFRFRGRSGYPSKAALFLRSLTGAMGQRRSGSPSNSYPPRGSTMACGLAKYSNKKRSNDQAECHRDLSGSMNDHRSLLRKDSNLCRPIGESRGGLGIALAIAAVSQGRALHSGGWPRGDGLVSDRISRTSRARRRHRYKASAGKQ